MSTQDNAISYIDQLRNEISELNAEFKLTTERHQMVSIQHKITSRGNQIERLLNQYDY